MSFASSRLARVALFTSLVLGVGACADEALDERGTRDRDDDDDDDGREGEGEGEGEPAEGEGEGEGEGETGQCTVDKATIGGNAVYFGTRSPSHVVLSTAQQRAVIGLQEGGAGGSVCSGTLITDTVVLTAVHCTEGTRAERFQVLFGVDDLNPEAVVDVIEKTENPDHDIAMLRLAHPASAVVEVTPIAAFAGTLTLADRGEIFEQAGYGATETSDGDGRFFVAEPFIGFEDDYLQVDGQGRHGVCFGDSGGPSLRQTPEGDVRVMGALSWGDETCVDVDRYTRVDLVQDWIEGFAGPIPLPGSVTVGCGTVTSTGRCSADGRVAEFCADDVLVTDACTGLEVCGDDDAGKRCILIADNPCGDVTDFGSCDGEVLSWCDDGVARTRDCAACGGDVCVLVDNVNGYGCVESACGDLDFLGECDGDTARWCSDGQIEELDCGGSGCAYIDDESGFYCR